MPRSALVRLLPIVLLAACARASSPPAPPSARGVTLGVTAANRFVKAYEEADVTAVVRIEAARLQHEERPPANLALLVDTSGSMEGRAIEDARAASLALVGALGPKDRLSVITFDSKTRVLLPSTLLDDADLPELRAAILGMKAEGTTDMAGGLRAALAEVVKGYDSHAVNRVVLLGDGAPNDARPIEETLAEASQRHVAVTALGLGADYNESLMGHVALATGGRFHYVSDSSKVKGFFEEEIARVHDACARSVALVLTPGPGVVIDSVVGQDAVRSGASVVLTLGDLSYGDRRDVVVKARAAEHRDGAAVEVLDAKLVFASEGSDTLERTAYLGVRATADVEAIAKGHDADVEQEALRMEAAAKTVETIKDDEARRLHDVPHAPAAPSAPAPLTALPDGTPDPSPAPAAASPPEVKEEHDHAMGVLLGH